MSIQKEKWESEKGKKLSRKEQIQVCAEFACVKLLQLGSDLISLPETHVLNQEKSDDTLSQARTTQRAKD